MNKWLFKYHSWMALAAFLPLCLLSVTGSLLVFKHEIDSLLVADKVRVAATTQSRLSLDELRSVINQQHPNVEPVGWALFQDQQRADLVYVIEHGSSDWQYLLLNQYSGEILAPPQALDHHFTDWLLELHAALLLDDAGMAVTALVALLQIFLGISGVILYRKFWTRLFTLRWNSRLIVYFSDLHKMVGIFASPVLLILGITGGYWSIVHVAHEVEDHWAGEEHHIVTAPLYNTAISLEDLRQQAQKNLPGFEATYISIPHEPERQLRFYGDVHSSNPLLSQYASMQRFDTQTGRHLDTLDIREAGALHKTLDSFRRLHFGDFAGLTSRMIWALVGIAPLILSVTGITIWCLRRRKKRSKRNRLAVAYE